MERNIQLELTRFYSVWKECNLAYEKWAAAQGLSSNGVLVLMTLSEAVEPCTQKQIGLQWGLPKQTVNHILREFLKKGYVALTAMPDDKRNKAIHLTDAGRTFAGDILGELHRKEARVAAAIGLDKLRDLDDTLARFVDLFAQEDRE